MKATNTYKEIRDDWYSWTILIKGTNKELAQIRQVTYQLHPTFPVSRMVSTNVANNFARTAGGWGEFLVHIEAKMKSGEKKTAELWLDLGFKHTKDEKAKYTGEFP